MSFLTIQKKSAGLESLEQSYSPPAVRITLYSNPDFISKPSFNLSRKRSHGSTRLDTCDSPPTVVLERILINLVVVSTGWALPSADTHQCSGTDLDARSERSLHALDRLHWLLQSCHAMSTAQLPVRLAAPSAPPCGRLARSLPPHVVVISEQHSSTDDYYGVPEKFQAFLWREYRL